jgi:hypothetical protein
LIKREPVEPAGDCPHTQAGPYDVGVPSHPVGRVTRRYPTIARASLCAKAGATEYLPVSTEK